MFVIKLPSVQLWQRLDAFIAKWVYIVIIVQNRADIVTLLKCLCDIV